MGFDYEAFEKECDAIRKINELHLAGFGKWLKSSGLSGKTIRKHVSNVDFYINDFLCYYDARDAVQGCYSVGSFLGDWFIRKASWASCGNIKSNVASFKKFYAFMLAVNAIEQEDYDFLLEAINNQLPDWLDAMKRYDDWLEEEGFL